MSSILEIRHLRTLRAIEETGSLAGAARLISLTQSALSHQLKQLEAYYEIPLFARDTRPMTLTETGHKLLDLANDILPRIDAAETTLGTDTTAGAAILLEILGSIKFRAILAYIVICQQERYKAEVFRGL